VIKLLLCVLFHRECYNLLDEIFTKCHPILGSIQWTLELKSKHFYFFLNCKYPASRVSFDLPSKEKWQFHQAYNLGFIYHSFSNNSDPLLLSQIQRCPCLHVREKNILIIISVFFLSYMLFLVSLTALCNIAC